MSKFKPSYIETYESGLLSERIKTLNVMLTSCTLCPRMCRVDRTAGRRGICRLLDKPVVSAYNAHMGEESSLVGTRGSGAIFMSSCNMNCAFCLNPEISQSAMGKEVSSELLSDMMIELWKRGCHNINIVSPTHQVAQVVASLPKAIEAGMDIPLVYNTGGYDSLEAIKLLDGIFDIYMPDLKYGSNEVAFGLSMAPSYVEISQEAAREMYRQVGELKINEEGLAVLGMIVRHLVLPAGYAFTSEVMRFVSEELSPETYVNIMDQYRPCHEAEDLDDYPEMNRVVHWQEVSEAITIAKEAGLKRIAGHMG